MASPNGTRRGGRGRRSDERSGPYAALDLGTNNCRLLIAHPSRSGRLRVVDSHSQVVRLGEGLATTGRLSDAAMERALDALKACLVKVKRHKPVMARYIATQACRAAENGQAFLTRVRRELGLNLDTITPKQEAKYALLGSLDLIDHDADFSAVIDIGGGSTEICWVDAKTALARGVSGCAARPPILGWASFPFGVVTLSEQFPGYGAPAYEDLVAHVRGLLEANDAAARFGPLFRAGRGQLIGNSGTVTSLAAVSMGLERYMRSVVDGSWIERDGALAACRRLAQASVEERAAEPCIGPERADLIVAGCAILEAIWTAWPAHRMRVGDRGLREGILLSMIYGPKKAGGRRPGKRRGPAGAASSPRVEE